MDHLVARCGRTITVAATCAVLLCSALTAVAQAKKPSHRAKKTSAAAKITPSTPVTPGSDYLALGDSVTFGYMEPTVVPTPRYADAASFDAYPEMLGSELHLRVANLACPGETSASLLNSRAQSNGCENTYGNTGVAYRRSFPLHVRYAGSQIAEAEHYLKTHPNTRLVSLMIGANDLFLCEKEPGNCASIIEQASAIGAIERNVRTILFDIRHKAHYDGQLVIVDYYSLDYATALDNTESQALNRAQAAGAAGSHVRFANAYATFAAASAHSGNDSCTAGLLTQLGVPGTCGVHPSYAGQALLASTLENAIRIH